MALSVSSLQAQPSWCGGFDTLYWLLLAGIRNVEVGNDGAQICRAKRDAKRDALNSMSGDTNGSLAYYQPRLRRVLHCAQLPKPARVARVGCLLNVNPRVGYAW
eukprot:9368890-Pyramimonas_sp.AAC.1